METILEPVIDDENIEFPTGSMVIKGEYFTLEAQHKRKGGYVYQDYRLGAIVYHFTSLVVVINIKLRAFSNKKKVICTILYTPYRARRLMDIIDNTYDPNHLLV